MSYVTPALRWMKRAMDNVKAIELALIGSLLWWAFILAIPLDSFGTGTSYRAMAGIAREEVWAGFFLLVAIANIYGMLSERPKIHMFALILQTGVWFFVSAMFAIGDLASTGTGIYFIVALLSSFVVYKVGEQNGR